MGFEIIAPIQRVSNIAIGECSINGNDRIHFTHGDLASVGITDKSPIAMLSDKMTSRIAIRAARGGEPATIARANKSKSIYWISCSAVLRSLGKTSEKCKGRRPVLKKDDMLTVQL